MKRALGDSVVELIQDLNGNHVIQKCIHKMEPNDNQFIYDAVAQHCDQVATHRHGCCVMQRCIDHASDQQRVKMRLRMLFCLDQFHRHWFLLKCTTRRTFYEPIKMCVCIGKDNRIDHVDDCARKRLLRRLL